MVLKNCYLCSYMFQTDYSVPLTAFWKWSRLELRMDCLLLEWIFLSGLNDLFRYFLVFFSTDIITFLNLSAKINERTKQNTKMVSTTISRREWAQKVQFLRMYNKVLKFIRFPFRRFFIFFILPWPLHSPSIILAITCVLE